MSKHIQDILAAVDEFEETPECRGLELRLSVSKLILEKLRETGLTQKALAAKAGIKESFLSRVLHANANCTLDTIGNLLFALGAQAELRDVATVTTAQYQTGTQLRIVREEKTHAQKTGTQISGTHEQVAVRRSDGTPFQSEAYQPFRAAARN